MFLAENALYIRQIKLFILGEIDFKLRHHLDQHLHDLIIKVYLKLCVFSVI